MAGEIGSAFVRIRPDTSGFKGETERGVRGAFSGIGGIIAKGTAGGIAALGLLGVMSARSAIQFESSFAGIRKTVDATEPQFEKLQRGIRDMAKEIPTGVNQLNAIGESAGQLGIARKAILPFIRTIADLGETTNLSGEQAASTMARIVNVMRLPQGQIRNLGSAIVALGNAGASTESEIADFALRIAGAGKIAGLTAGEVLAIGNAFSSIGIEAEAGGTAISKVLLNMNSAALSGGKQLQGFAEIAGMSGAQFQKAFRDDAAGTFTTFVEGLDRITKQGGDASKALAELGLVDARLNRAFLGAAGSGDILRQSIELGNRAWKENTALTIEAEKRYETTGAQLGMLRNRWTDLKITIGEQMLPIINDAIQGFVRLAEQVGAAPTITAKLNVIWDVATESIGDLWGKLKAKLRETFSGEARQVVDGGKVDVVFSEVNVVGTIKEKLQAAVQAAFGGTERKVVDAGKIDVITDQIDWNATAVRMAKQFSTALAAGGTFTGQLTVALTKAVGHALANADWTSIGSELAIGFGKAGLNFEKAIEEGFGKKFGPAIAKSLENIPFVGPVMKAFKQIGPALETEAQAATIPMARAGKGLGEGVKKGVAQGVQGTAAQVGQRLTTVAATAAGKIGQFHGIGLGLGTALGGGIKSGLEAALAGLGASMVAKVNAAVAQARAAVKAESPSKVTAVEIGEPMGLGVLMGWINGTRDLPSKMTETLRKAIDKAVAIVEGARSRFADAFQGMSDRILRAFDAQTSGHETATQQLLREQDERRTMEDLLLRQAEAQKKLNEAITAGDAAAVAAAQRDLARATEDVQRPALEKQAEQERIQYESSREELRLALEKRLEVLQKHWAKIGVNSQKALNQLNALLMKVGLTSFTDTGQQLGNAFVTALSKAIRDAIRRGGTIASAIDAALVTVTTGVTPPIVAPPAVASPIAPALGGVQTVLEDLLVEARAQTALAENPAPVEVTIPTGGAFRDPDEIAMGALR